ncbi:MAG: acetolactate synthase-1/3 small subunit [Polaribacter sp.]|jgi:acetolactate synthase-1/3 small subunit
MKKQITISVFTENHSGLLSRVTAVFTRRKINIDSLIASESEVEDIYRFTIVVEIEEVQVKKIVKQLEKQVEVLKAFYHLNEEVVHQELALYKVPTKVLASGGQVEEIVRNHNARLLAVEAEFVVLEKTGHKEDIDALFTELLPFGILEFARSGRVAITKSMKELKDYLVELEEQNKQTS